jgi:F-type H+-transporting ATPase subunit delta
VRSAKKTRRVAKRLFRLALADGTLDEGRVRLIVDRLAGDARSANLMLLSAFLRLIRMDQGRRTAAVTSASPLPHDLRAQLEASVARLYGQGITTLFDEDPSLLGGVRVAVGSDVYDGSVKAGLTALAARL